MDDELEAGGGREMDVISGDVNAVLTMGRTFQGDLESGGVVYNSIVEADPANEVELEIRNLLGFTDEVVNHKTLCKGALEEWQNKVDWYGNRVDKRKAESHNINNEIYQVVGFFSAFQGLLLTAVAQSSLLHKNNRAFPLALSAFATVLTVIAVGQKNKQIREMRRNTKYEDPARKVHTHYISLCIRTTVCLECSRVCDKC
jgi:hypothetical protein